MPRVSIENTPDLPYAVEEAINRLRINIGFMGSDVRKIMMVSSVQNEGKSFLTFQVWKQMAESGVKSLLIDADLRKSIMVDKYGIKREDGGKMEGTSQVLSDERVFTDAIYETPYEKGFILPNTDNVVNPSMLLENRRFEELLEYAGKEYRYTFLDVPPLDLVSDGERIGSLCDGAILVVRGGVTPKSIVKNSVKQLERAGCPILGVILNRVEGSKSGYYYKRYGGRYYRYGKYGGYYYGNEYYYGKSDKK